MRTTTGGHETVSSHNEHLASVVEHREVKKSANEHDTDRIDQTVDEAMDDAKKLAERADESRKNEEETKIPAQKRRAPSRHQRSVAFKETMKDVRQELSPTSRLTSRIIHNRVVETMSDFIASTIARPNALLSGSIVAFISVTLLYFFAKNYGYQLSGFETIGMFILGWILGIIYDYVSLGIRNKR